MKGSIKLPYPSYYSTINGHYLSHYLTWKCKDESFHLQFTWSHRIREPWAKMLPAEIRRCRHFKCGVGRPLTMPVCVSLQWLSSHRRWPWLTSSSLTRCSTWSSVTRRNTWSSRRRGKEASCQDLPRHLCLRGGPCSCLKESTWRVCIAKHSCYMLL